MRERGRQADGEGGREKKCAGVRRGFQPSADVLRIMPTELHGWQGGGGICVSGSTMPEGRKIGEN